MEAGFFLDLADNTGDGFSYNILPKTWYVDIIINVRPVISIFSVVRSRDYAPTEAPRCVKEDNGFKFYNAKGLEFFLKRNLILNQSYIEY